MVFSPSSGVPCLVICTAPARDATHVPNAAGGVASRLRSKATDCAVRRSRKEVNVVLEHVSDEESLEVLRRNRLAHLACVADGAPYVVPVYYVLEGRVAYVHSRPGRKVDALRKLPRACLQVEEIHDEFHWTSALADGDYIEVTEPVERGRILAVFAKRHPHLTPVETVAPSERENAVVFAIRILRVSGVRESL